MVDNSSDDGSAAMVESEFPFAQLIAPGKNLGYAQGNNRGFECALGDLILTLNPDTEVNESTFEAAIQAVESAPDIGCVGVRQLGVDGKVQQSVRGFPSVVGILGDLLGASSGRLDSYRRRSFDYEVEQEAPQPMGTFLLFKRAALEAIGDPRRPFDPDFPIFFNEVDLLYRMSRGGFRCVYTPNASVLHYGGESTRQRRPQMIWESHRSLLRYLNKHAPSPLSRFGLIFLAPLVYAGALARAKGYHGPFRS